VREINSASTASDLIEGRAPPSEITDHRNGHADRAIDDHSWTSAHPAGNALQRVGEVCHSSSGLWMWLPGARFWIPCCGTVPSPAAFGFLAVGSFSRPAFSDFSSFYRASRSLFRISRRCTAHLPSISRFFFVIPFAFFTFEISRCSTERLVTI